MKLVGTRIRVETSEHKTEHFPEYCLEEKSLFGKLKENWYGTSPDSTHNFGDAWLHVGRTKERYTLEWAKLVIDTQATLYKEHLEYNEHQNTKQISYVKHP